MLRHCFLLVGLLAATTFSIGGCRSCDTCHDYDPPVANCACHACGTHRAGSASSGYVGAGPAGGQYIEGEYYEVEGEAAGPPAENGEM